MSKLLTIIIPTYNMEKYLGRCLSSLEVESCMLEELEVLVIDDGSTDKSLEIAEDYETRYPTVVKAIHKENGNYGSCVNRGLAEATGQYVKVLDADDWFDTSNLSALLRQMRDWPEADAIISAYDIVDPDGDITFAIRYPFPQETEFPLSAMSGEAMRQIMMHAVAYRLAPLRQMGYSQSEGISYTDQEWVYRPMAQAKKIRYYDRPVYKYMLGREGQTVNNVVWERNFWMELQGMRRMLDEYKQLPSDTAPEAVRYMQERLAFRSFAIYEAYFIRFASTRNNQLLQDFDKHLYLTYRSLWDKADTYSIFGLKYVRQWRHRGYPKHIIGLRACKTLARWKKRLLANKNKK